jgi:hypothetical protein
MPPIGLEGREGYAPLQRDSLFTWRARYRIPSRVNAMRRSVIDSRNWLEVSSVIRHPRWGQRLGVVSGRYTETLRAKVDTRSAGGELPTLRWELAAGRQEHSGEDTRMCYTRVDGIAVSRIRLATVSSSAGRTRGWNWGDIYADFAVVSIRLPFCLFKLCFFSDMPAINTRLFRRPMRAAPPPKATTRHYVIDQRAAVATS